jgi:hypothetical protein
MQEGLKILQQTVRMQASQQILAERQRRALDRGISLT